MKLLRAPALLLAAALLGGCAALSSVTGEVSSYGEWPASRAPGTYTFERLPSQQALDAESDALEAAAAPALALAGFKPAAAGQDPDVLVQVGARSQRTEGSRWDDRLWWSAGFGHWRRGYGLAPRWSLAYGNEFARYDREVALLIRDRASGKPLFEARATNEGLSRDDPALQAALFRAAMTDFPKLGLNPRRVTVALPPQP
jgi:Domain of unknown function (DUF4136)